jgi:predicted DNA-binding transcriptional regulator YafY
MKKPQPQLTRQWRLLQLLSRRRIGSTVEQLAGWLGVSLKTIRRDIIAWRDAGVPMESVELRFGKKIWVAQIKIEKT